MRIAKQYAPAPLLPRRALPRRRQEECKMLSELIPTCLSLSVTLRRLSRYFFAILHRHGTYAYDKMQENEPGPF